MVAWKLLSWGSIFSHSTTVFTKRVWCYCTRTIFSIDLLGKNESILAVPYTASMHPNPHGAWYFFRRFICYFVTCYKHEFVCNPTLYNSSLIAPKIAWESIVPRVVEQYTGHLGDENCGGKYRENDNWKFIEQDILSSSREIALQFELCPKVIGDVDWPQIEV